MKKFFKAAVALIAVVVLACAFAGCTANVSGKTYAFSEVKIDLPKDATDAQKTAAEFVKGTLATASGSLKHTFKEDGKMGSGINTWKQKGKEVTIYVGETETVAEKFTVNGNKLEQGVEKSGYSFILVFTQQK
ncbi:MAG: hypothetical protein K2J61_03615 [Clostridia bacterium]|nr:hypothetical protein [Clostridia bacterium]